MKQHIDTTRRQLGELGAMANQTESMERKILARAQAKLIEVEAGIKKVRPLALVPGAAKSDEYQELILERGRLHQVIAQANAVLQ